MGTFQSFLDFEFHRYLQFLYWYHLIVVVRFFFTFHLYSYDKTLVMFGNMRNPSKEGFREIPLQLCLDFCGQANSDFSSPAD